MFVNIGLGLIFCDACMDSKVYRLIERVELQYQVNIETKHFKMIQGQGFWFVGMLEDSAIFSPISEDRRGQHSKISLVSLQRRGNDVIRCK